MLDVYFYEFQKLRQKKENKKKLMTKTKNAFDLGNWFFLWRF